MERVVPAGLIGALAAAVIAAQDPSEELQRLRREVDEARAAAIAANERLEMLATVVQLRNAEEAAASLFPAWPENVAAMESWLQKSAELAERRGPMERALAEIRARAMASADSGWRFAEVADQFLHDTLARLSAELGAFLADDGLMRDVQDRLAWARRVQGESLQERRGEWQSAIDAIAKSPIYGGLQLAPQIGLVPVGPDPQSGLWEFAHLRSGGLPERDAARGELQIGAGTGLVFVLLPGGRFRMGCQAKDPSAANYDPHARAAETPVHEVALAPFFISRYELTRAQWLRLTKARTEQPEDLDRQPVARISWADCQGVLSRHALVLPTEAQWEYACRAGTTTPFWSGTTAASLQGSANIADTSAKQLGGSRASEDWLDDGFPQQAPVGSFHPNPYGLFDMHGNLWEWCRDVRAPYATAARPEDGRRAATDVAQRALRGGSFDSTAVDVRSAIRRSHDPELRDSRIGVRPTRTVH